MFDCKIGPVPNIILCHQSWLLNRIEIFEPNNSNASLSIFLTKAKILQSIRFDTVIAY